MAISSAVESKASAQSRWSTAVDLRYRWPSRYRIGWYALAATAVLSLLLEPGAYRGASRELITALAGCLLVASLGQVLVVMVGAIDLAVPGYMTLSAAVNVHYAGSQGSARAFIYAVLACAVVSAISGALISILRLNALVVTLAINTMIT